MTDLDRSLPPTQPPGPIDRTPGRTSMGETIGQTYRDEGLWGAVKETGRQVGQSFLPSTGFDRDASIGDKFKEFVQFLPVIGDVEDAWSAVTGRSGGMPLDRTERALSAFGGAGLAGVSVAALGYATTSHHQRAQNRQGEIRQMNARRHAITNRGIDPNMMPVPGRSWQEEGVDLEAFDLTRQQMREQAIGWEYMSARAREPHRFGLLDASSFSELAYMVADAQDMLYLSSRDLAPLQRNLQALGSAIVKNMDPGAWQAEGMSLEQAQLTAATFSVVTWLRAMDLKLVKDWHPDASGDLEFALTDKRRFESVMRQKGAGGKRATQAAQYMTLMSQLTVEMLSMGVDSNLKTDPGSRISAVVPNLETGTMETYISILNEFLPTDRMIDLATGKPVNLKLLNDVAGRVDWETMTGDMAVNMATELAQEFRSEPARFSQSTTWYPRAARMSAFLSKATGVEHAKIGAVFSALSPQTAWVPNNLVSAIHAIIRYSMPDLDVASPEYRQLVIDTIKEGDWTADLMKSRSEERRELYKTEEALLEYYSDPNNMVNKTGSWGALAEKKKANDVAMLLLSDAPWQAVLMMSKTHTFSHLFEYPDATGVGVIDVHTNNSLVGTPYVEPKGSKSTKVGVNKKGLATESNTGYTHTYADVEKTAAWFKEQGLTDDHVLYESVDKNGNIKRTTVKHYLEGMRKVPNDYTAATYAAQQHVMNLVAGAQPSARGVATTNAAQAAGWVRSQELKEYIGELLKKKTPEARQEAWRLGLRSGLIPAHFEGTPIMQPTAVHKVQNVSTDIDVEPWHSNVGADEQLHVPSGKNGKKAVEGVGVGTVVMAFPDGSVRVFADPDNVAVADNLRHAYPATKPEWSGRAIWLPRRQSRVKDVKKVVESQKATKGEARVRLSTGTPPVGLRPGNWGVFEFRSMEEAQAALGELNQLDHRFTGKVVPNETVITQRGGAVADWSRKTWDDPAKSPVTNTEWAVIEAPAERMEELRTRLGERYGRIHPTTGTYGGVENPGYIVFDPDYTHMMELGREFAQESISIPQGILFTTGEAAGQLLPFDPESVQLAGFKKGKSDWTRLDETGYGFSYDVDGEMRPFDPNADSSSVRPSHTVEVYFDGVSTGIEWSAIERVSEALAAKAASSAVYTHGKALAPKGWVRAYEHHYTDGRFDASTRTLEQAPVDVAHAVPVYVPASEVSRLGAKADPTAGGRRKPSELDKALIVDEGAATPEDLKKSRGVIEGASVPEMDIAWPYGAEVSWDNAGSRLLKWTVDGKRPRQFRLTLEGHPLLEIGDDFGLPSPGVVVGTISDGGNVKLLSTHSQYDAVRASELLGAVNVSVAKSERGAAKDQPHITIDEASTVTIVDNAGASSGTHRTLMPQQPAEEFAKVGKAEEITGYTWFSTHWASEQLISDVATKMAWLEGKLEADPNHPIARFQAEMGTPVYLSPQALQGGVRFTTMVDRAADQSYTKTNQTGGGYAGTGYDFDTGKLDPGDHHGMYINDTEAFRGATKDTTLGALYPKSVKMKHFAAPPDTPYYEAIMVHELGHAVEASLADAGLGATLNQHVKRYREYSPFQIKDEISVYALENPKELFAETFVNVVYNPNAPAWQKDQVRVVLDVLKRKYGP